MVGAEGVYVNTCEVSTTNWTVHTQNTRTETAFLCVNIPISSIYDIVISESEYRSTCTASVKLAVWKNKPIWKQEKNCYRAKMWYVIPEVTSCVFVFIGSVFLTVLLVSSRHGWYHRLDHACVTWINSSRDISFLLVQILARDHGSLGLSVWSIDATISPIFSSFFPPTHPGDIQRFRE